MDVSVSWEKSRARPSCALVHKADTTRDGQVPPGGTGTDVLKWCAADL
jgi:hypothetical protein